jgi:hypothetical protein
MIIAVRKKCPRVPVRTFGITIAFAVINFSVNPLLAQPLKTLPGHVPAQVSALAPVGRLAASNRLNLAIGLPLRNPQLLADSLRQIYDPASPEFHHYLTPEQFTEQFGPSTDDYQAVLEFARTNGFTVISQHPNRMLLDVNASVGDIERAFHLKVQTYQHPTEPRTFYAPDADPSVDSNLPILDVSGMNNFELPRPHAHVRPVWEPRATNTPAGGSGPGGSYQGSDFRAAYLSGISATGLGQTVGLVEFDGYYANDVTLYEQETGVPNVPVMTVLLGGFNGAPGGANLEVALDIEVASGIAPGLSNIIVYEAPPTGALNTILSRMATDNSAKQLSSSWTSTGGPNATTDQLFQQLQAQGQSFFLASGDSGAYTGSINAVAEPADNPYITVVGGTVLATDAQGNWAAETTWSGSSGGISTSYSIPNWQQSVDMSANQGSTTMRNIPDVALTAENVWIVYDNGSGGAAYGTSCAAPLWAGLVAVLNQQAAANGKPPIGFIHPAIYSLAAGTSYGAYFNDITTGNNFNSASPTLFSAVPGFDLCTGLGTPIGSGLMSALAGSPAPKIAFNGATIAQEGCTNGAVDPGETVTVNISLINVGTGNTSNLVATLQATGGVTSPTGPQNYGAIASGASISQPFTFTASGSCGGNITGTLQLQDGSSNLGTTTFTLHLGQAINLQTSENFDEVTAPTLPTNWVSSPVSGTEVDWITTIGVSDSAPNSAFALDGNTTGYNVLTSPVIPIVSSTASLTFQQNYSFSMNIKGHPRPATNCFDGGVLEIAIGNGGFTDILSAGGSFVTGGYNVTLSLTNGNVLGGRRAWGGSSGGWAPVTVSLPAAAAGQNIQLRWGLGTGTNHTSPGVGWYLDSILIQDAYSTCCTSPVTSAPGIIASPTNLVATAGDTVKFGVSATGTAPLDYFWFFNSTNLIGGDTNLLCLTNAQADQAGNYSVIVSNAAGSITSSPATLTILSPPTIITPPTNFMASLGDNANFSVTASGTAPLNYFWYFNGTNLVGPNTNSLLLTNVQPDEAGSYLVVITNAAGSITSSPVTLTVLAPPSIVSSPTNLVVTAGDTVKLSVSATGSAPLNYLWFFNTNLIGTNTNSLCLTNVQPDEAGTYVVVVTNMAGSTSTSPATLRVLVPPLMTSAAITGTTLSISINSVPGLNYILEYKTNLSDASWVAISPPLTGNGDVLILQDTNAVDNNRFYRVLCQ